MAAHRTRTADMVVAVGGRVIPVLLQLTRSVPIIVPGGSDPVASGWIESVRRPGGNLSGFAIFEPSIVGKMLEMLKQIAPAVSRIAMIYNPDNPNAVNFASSYKASAGPLAVETIIAHVHELADIERAIKNVAEKPNSGFFSLWISHSPYCASKSLRLWSDTACLRYIRSASS